MLNDAVDLRTARMPIVSLVLAVLAAVAWSAIMAHGVGSWAGWGFVTVEAAVLMMLVLSLSPRTERNTVVLLFVAGLLIRTVQIVIVQHLPNVADRLPDALMYDLHARALVLHWQGVDVPAAQYGLAGLMARGIATWKSTTGLGYASVFGTRHFLYQLYVGVVYWFSGADAGAVMMSHGVLLAALTPAVYLLTRALFPERPLAPVLAVCLLFLDFNFAAVSAFLLKDSLSALMLTLTLLTTVQVHRGARWYPAALLTLLLVGFSVLRYHVVIAFWLAALLVGIWTWRQRASRTVLAVIAGSFLIGALAYSPEALTRGASHLLSDNLATVAGGFQTLQTSSQAANSTGAGSPALPNGAAESIPAMSRAAVAAEGYDEATANWLQAVRANPVQAVVKTVAHTLLAPYPWVPLFAGFSYNFTELLYPGVILWILALPFTVLGIRYLPFRSQSILFALIWATLIVGAYVVFHGEFSGRQRIFMMPLVWVLASYGVDRAWAAWKARGAVKSAAMIAAGGDS